MRFWFSEDVEEKLDKLDELLAQARREIQPNDLVALVRAVRAIEEAQAIVDDLRMNA